MPQERGSHRDAGAAPGDDRPAGPVGFLALRLEHTAAGVRATLHWNTDVERRYDDRQSQTLDLDSVPARIHDFILQFVDGRP
jgi:hypothetical protein